MRRWACYVSVGKPQDQHCAEGWADKSDAGIPSQHHWFQSQLLHFCSSSPRTLLGNQRGMVYVRGPLPPTRPGWNPGSGFSVDHPRPLQAPGGVHQMGDFSCCLSQSLSFKRIFRLSKIIQILFLICIQTQNSVMCMSEINTEVDYCLQSLPTLLRNSFFYYSNSAWILCLVEVWACV